MKPLKQQPFRKGFTMNAAELIDAGFLAMLQEHHPDAFKEEKYMIGQWAWAAGEAEDWLRQIASGNVTLGISHQYVTGLYCPCLRD
jgi:hypothetical protein